jgi:GAF domain-containing protein
VKDSFARQVASMGDDDLIRAILAEVCRITNMGFVAVARVTEKRWIACQVADEIEFGLKPGDELEIQTTICDEIRECGCAIVIDHVDADPEWRNHPTPAKYGFQSYASFPIKLADGSFYGTLCAIDPNPRALSARAMVSVLERQAQRIAEIISAKMQAEPVSQPQGQIGA